MLWVTRHEPDLDRCASAWLIKRFIDADASFAFINMGETPPTGGIPFVLPGAEVNPVAGVSTALDALVAKYGVTDAVALRIASFVHDYEVDAGEDATKLKLPEAAGVFKVIRGLARISESDEETVGRALVVFDSLYAELTAEAAQLGGLS